jgi:Na+/H+ antiporter NhaD/arsenite permease-like protein
LILLLLLLLLRKMLVFLGCIFCPVQAVRRTGLLQGLSVELNARFGTALTVALRLIGAIGLLSSLLANIPVVTASITMVKRLRGDGGGGAGGGAGAHFVDWPAATVPVFVAMMFGAPLGGNATLIGASATVVSAGVCTGHGRRLTFVGWPRYGVPFTLCQLSVGALYECRLSSTICGERRGRAQGLWGERGGT